MFRGAAVREHRILNPFDVRLRVQPGPAQARRHETVLHPTALAEPDLPAAKLLQARHILGAKEIRRGVPVSPSTHHIDVVAARALDDRRLDVDGGRDVHAALLHHQCEPLPLQWSGDEAAALVVVSGEPLFPEEPLVFRRLDRPQVTHVVSGVGDQDRLVQCAHFPLPLAAWRRRLSLPTPRRGP